MNPHAAVAQRLTLALQLDQPPIALSLVERAPEGVPPHGGRVPAGCSFWQDAAQRVFATIAADHARCTVGMHTHGMAPGTDAERKDLSVSLQVFDDLGYVRTEDLAGIPTLPSAPKSVVYAPLAATPLDPDVVLVFADSRQGLVVAEAVSQLEGGVPPALGRPACAIVPQVIGTGRAALSLGCCGARAYLDGFTESVALWALPGARLEEYVARIEVLANANRVLTRFHVLRRADVEAGGHPSIAESLARLEASG